MIEARRFRVRAESGYAMAALLVAMAVIGIALGAAMPVWKTMAQREREAELIFRGEQYARAVRLFQRRYANALPPDVDILINERFLRKRYKDPITGDDFELLGAATPLPGVTDPLGAAGRGGAQQGRGAAPQGGGARQGRGAQQGGSQASALQQQMEATRERLAQMSQQLQQRAGGQLGSGGVPGGMIGVASKSTARSLRLYNGRDRYNEWLFLGTGATTTPGAPGDAEMEPGGGRGRGAQQPGLEQGGRGGRGGRGAAPGGRGGGRGLQGGQGGARGGGFQPGRGGGAPGGRGRGGQ